VTVKRPKFFCESCGEEVRQNDRVCPHCGRFFSSVKCPSCGFSGDAKRFREGCPKCGYAIYGKGFTPATREVPKKKETADPLPWWMYAASALLLALLVAIILLWK
jgi:uncharacterized membrane protein YvbJ